MGKKRKKTVNKKNSVDKSVKSETTSNFTAENAETDNKKESESEKSEKEDVKLSEFPEIEGSPYEWWKSGATPAALSGLIIPFAVMLMITGAFLGYSIDYKSSFASNAFKFFKLFYVAAPLVLFIRLGLIEKVSANSNLKLAFYLIGAILAAGSAFVSFGLSSGSMIITTGLLAGIAFYVYSSFKSLHRDDAWFNYFTVFTVFTALFGLAAGFYSTDFRMYRLFVTPKILSIYPLASVLLIFVSLWVLSNKKIIKNIYIPFFILLAVYGLWEIFNVYHSGMPRVSFYGSVVRRMGAITVFSMLIFALAVQAWTGKSILRIRFLLYFFLIIGLFLSLRGFTEITLTRIKAYRPSGFAGNPDFFGDHFIYIILVSFFLYFKEKKTKLIVFNLISFLLGFYALVLTHTRGAWLGLAIASFVGMFFFNPARDLEKRVLMKRALILLFSMFAGFIIYYAYVGSNINLENVAPRLKGSAKMVLHSRISGTIFVFITISPLIFKTFWSLFSRQKERLYFISAVAGFLLLITVVPKTRNLLVHNIKKAVKLDTLLNSKNGEARFNVWKDAVPMMKKHWLTGVGRETFRVRFLKYKSFNLAIKDPGVNYRSSHNMYIDELTMEGLPGLLLFLSVIGMGLWLALKYGRRKYHAHALATAIPLVGYSGHVLVSYDVIPTLMSMYLFAALSISVGITALQSVSSEKAENSDENEKSASESVNRFAKVFAVLGILAGLVILVFSINFVKNEAKADLNLTAMTRSKALLTGYASTIKKIAPQNRQLLVVKQAFNAYKLGSNDRKVIAVLSSFTKIKPQILVAKKDQILPKLKKTIDLKINALQGKVQNFKRSYKSRVVKNIKLIWEKAHETVKLIPDMGYVAYMCGNMIHTLAKLPEDDLRILGGKDKILKEAVKFALSSTKNNTNPESAYSRLGSIYYYKAFYHMRKKQLGKAYKYFKKALDAVQGSINYDKYYYDTHRLKGVILLERFCKYKQAEKELNIAKNILKNSRVRAARRAEKRLEATGYAILKKYRDNPVLLERCKRNLKIMKQAAGK